MFSLQQHESWRNCLGLLCRSSLAEIAGRVVVHRDIMKKWKDRFAAKRYPSTSCQYQPPSSGVVKSLNVGIAGGNPRCTFIIIIILIPNIFVLCLTIHSKKPLPKIQWNSDVSVIFVVKTNLAFCFFVSVLPFWRIFWRLVDIDRGVKN